VSDPHRTWPALNPAGPFLNKLKQQSQDRIDQRRGKDPFGRLIPVRINIIGEKCDIQQETGYRHGRDLVPMGMQEGKELPDSHGRELHIIIDDKAYDWGYQPKQDAQPQVVFFEDHDFHVFSSLLFRT